MTDIPSSALAAAAVSADTLAGLVLDLVAGLPVDTATAQTIGRAARRARFLAPRIVTQADVAAIARILTRAIRDVARAATPGDASTALYAAAAGAREAYPRTASPALTRAYRFAQALAAGIEVSCLGEAFLAEARSAFVDRPSGDRARSRIGAAMEASGDRIAGLLGQATYGALNQVALQAGAYLAQEVATLRPVVVVQAQAARPSTALAYALYGDPARGAELVARNAIATPLFCGPTIEALSPSA
ncbi:hypothetical protein NS228_06160 [Methylobacterium indicum]|uniref:hypothetical protein n=1 Tax=Methylobacterium indicum TaxID=1775910 RepID=UPI000734604F|nr:hypothetical protein [Methylobacterium indicum]KTS30868.1 hypothetical protein NS229_14670 [Methylobacterium indicum]KTS41544.1 hypothetical protein NS228_06160 [Methylobacterium indicum]KTS52402.1 hypothetical protein NS230_09755 [Methylobacterium indicum]